MNDQTPEVIKNTLYRKYWNIGMIGRTNQVENTFKPIMDARLIGQKKNLETLENFIFTGENPR